MFASEEIFQKTDVMRCSPLLPSLKPRFERLPPVSRHVKVKKGTDGTACTGGISKKHMLWDISIPLSSHGRCTPPQQVSSPEVEMVSKPFTLLDDAAAASEWG